MTEDSFVPTRRRYLRAVGAVGIVGMAGCSGDGGGSSNDGAGSGGETAGDDDTGSSGSADGDSGSADVTPWMTLHANPERTQSTPGPVPQGLAEVASTGAREFNPRGVPSQPRVTGDGVFLFGPEAVGRFDLSTLENEFSQEFGRRAALGRTTIPGYVEGETVVAGVEDTVTGLSIADGNREWIVDRTGSATEGNLNVPFSAGNGVGFVTKGEVGVLGVDAQEVRWRESVSFITEGLRPRPPVVHTESGTVFVAFETDVFAFDIETGEERWSLTRNEPTPLAVQGETLYVVDTDGVVAVDRTDGSMQWEQLRTEISTGVFGGPRYAVDEDGLYVMSSTDSVIAFDPSDGTELWSTPFTGSAPSVAAGGDGLVYGTDAGIRVLSKENGESQASLDTSMVGGISIAGGRIYGWKDENVGRSFTVVGSG
ncbi:MAG: PQQ-binding-like beta-propeller repeat protein [Halovenus sp.]